MCLTSYFGKGWRYQQNLHITIKDVSVGMLSKHQPPIPMHFNLIKNLLVPVPHVGTWAAGISLGISGHSKLSNPSDPQGYLLQQHSSLKMWPNKLSSSNKKLTRTTMPTKPVKAHITCFCKDTFLVWPPTRSIHIKPSITKKNNFNSYKHIAQWSNFPRKFDNLKAALLTSESFCKCF